MDSSDMPPIGIPFTNGIGDNTDLGFLDISLSPAKDQKIHKFGFFVGESSDIQPTSETITFFGTGGVLGSTSVRAPADLNLLGLMIRLD
jgi:hypothetical protein